jgi:Succinylglutamate desuccinylase / Aspartoacylase family
MLTIFETLPDGLLEADAHDLREILPGPALIHLSGQRQPALFASVLLHGNEGTGLKAMQRVLRKYAGRSLPRDLSLFVGNVRAAAQGLRRLDGQPDYNRVWPGWEQENRDPEIAPTAEHTMARQVTEIMRERGAFASLDIHNNTGVNPHYACVNRLEQPFFHLANLFSRTVVYFVRPKGVQSAAFAEFCPAVTVECGKPETEAGIAHAAEFVEACLHLAHFPEHPVARHDIDLFHTVATVKVPPDLEIGFGEDRVPLVFPEALDHMNFRELPVGTPLAAVTHHGIRLDVRDEAGEEAFDRFFRHHRGSVVTRRQIMPSMLTRDARIIRQDCLCYLMERLDLEH